MPASVAHFHSKYGVNHMNANRASWCAVSALVFALGCGADAGGGSPGAGDSETNAATETDFGTTAEATPGGDVAQTHGASASGTRVAQLDFEDGNQVFFEELDGGVLVTEVGPQTNLPHLKVKPEMTALAAFQALAPSRAVPNALMKAHLHMYPVDAVTEPVKDEAIVEGSKLDADLEHNGQFQQSALPFATFAAQMCDFPTTSPNYKHHNVTTSHTHPTDKVNTAYYAVGSDVGIITAKACVNGTCSTTANVQAGVQLSGFYDGGLACDKDCSHILFFSLGCVSICNKKQVKFEGVFSAISSRVRYHDCARFTR